MVSPPSAPAKSQLKGIAINFEMRPLGCFKFQHAEIFLSFWMVNKICDFRRWYNLTFGKVYGFVQKGGMSSVIEATEGHL